MEASTTGQPLRRTLSSALLLSTLVLLPACPNGSGVVPPPSGTFPPAEVLRERIVTTMCDTEEFQQLADTIGTRAERLQDESLWVLVSAVDLTNSQVHDCQRLINGTLGPPVSVLVSRSRVQDNLRLLEGVVVADIVNHDGNLPYEPLNIEGGINCLWLEGDTNSTTNWTALLWRPDTDCAAESTPSALAHTLEVRRLVFASAGPADYPSTGRWLWDFANDQQAIGIRCGNAWCEIGSPGFETRTNVADKDSVPGWFDEQYLSYSDGAGGLILSSMFARIEPGVHNQQEERNIGDGDRHVATLTFPGNDAAAFQAYVDKFSLDPTENSHDMILQTRGDALYLSAGRNVWSMVTWSPHTHSGSGTVRWAWDERDEGTWFPCEGGCCKKTEIDP